MWTKSPQEHRGTENEEEATSDIDGESSGNAKILNITTVVVVIWHQIVISHDFCLTIFSLSNESKNFVICFRKTLVGVCAFQSNNRTTKPVI